MHIKWIPFVISAMALALAAGHAVAQTPDASAPKTRAQVQQELREAQRAGNLPALGDSGQMLNEVYPSRYPAPSSESGLTREQVKAELLEAQRTGNLVGLDDSGQMLKELYPTRYPATSGNR